GDAGPGDAGPGDAGPGDAGPGDAGPGDAGPGDAGPGDAGPGTGPDGGPLVDPSAPLAAGSSVAAKGLGALLVAAAVATGGAVLWDARSEDRAPRASPPAAETAGTAPEAARTAEDDALPTGADVPAEPPPVDPEPAIAETEATPPPAAPRDEPARSVAEQTAPDAVEPEREVDPAAEAALVRRAQAALATEPARALSLAAEHRRRFGEGTLGQEREVVAIDALSRLGRDVEARRRAAAFRARWPGSAHLRRLDVILE
ncbi:MAG TPA: hypothetical protein RMH99_25065, partial [Sandaracinaceae bacterium LLY-WYZ-13_1]|nr:hypothetical protein [Sandaracinaceae bacterium LLY-WYZ-13_1]